MANCCDFDANLKFDTEEQAEAFEKGTGGCEHPLCVELPGGRCVFDGGIERAGRLVYVFGWVKWAMYEVDMVDIVRGAPGLRSLFAEMREDGCQVKGEYRWSRTSPEQLEVKWLPSDAWPEWRPEYAEDDGLEEWDDAVDAAWAERAKSETLSFEKILAVANRSGRAEEGVRKQEGGQ